MLQKLAKTPSKSSKSLKPTGKLEAAVKKVVKDVLKGWGCYQFWPVQGAGVGLRSIDCIACVPVRITSDMVGRTLGVFVGIETKRENVSTPTARQQHTMETMQSAGGVAILVNSIYDLEVESQIIEAIKAGPNGRPQWIKL